MSARAELIERVEKATGPSREIDALVVVSLNLKPDWLAKSTGSMWIDMVSLDEPVIRFTSTGMKRSGGNPPIGDYPAFSASLDAVVALVEKQKPGWAYGFDGGPKTKIAFVDPHDFADRFLGARFTAEAATPALALLLAFLRSIGEE